MVSPPSSALFGRENEARTLRDAYEDCFGRGGKGGGDPHRRQHIVLIHGPSGTGKTALATQTLRPMLTKDNGLLLAGKADSTAQWSRPYQIFVSALQRLIQLLENDRLGRCNGPCQSEDDSKTPLQDIRTAILKEFFDDQDQADKSSDGRLLNNIIPGFEKILQTSSTALLDQSSCTTCTPAEADGASKANDAVVRLRHLLHRLCRTVASQCHLVMLLDDIQWCDNESLQLLTSIISSTLVTSDGSGESPILFVCTYRDNDEYLLPSESPDESNSSMHNPNGTSESPLSEFLQQTNAISSQLQVQKIPLDVVDEGKLNEILSGMYGLPEMEFYSRLIYKVSSGNIYLAIQCVRQLCEEDLLFRCQETNEWKWDFSQLQAQDDATAQFLLNPAFSDIVRHKIMQLSEQAQYFLNVASLFGMEIDLDVMGVIFGGSLDENSQNSSLVDELLEESIDEGLVVIDPIIGRNAFSHDRVQQAAHALIKDVDALSFEVGYKLWKTCSPTVLREKIFPVTTLLNKGQRVGCPDDMLPEVDCYGVARLNMEAGEKAVSIAAFSDATRYLERGLALLIRGAGSDDGAYWREDYQLSLNLLSATAEVQAFHHNFERVDKLIDEVCTHAKRFEDKHRALMARIKAKILEGKLQEAVDTGADMLRELGEDMASKASIPVMISEQMRTMLILRGKSNDDLLALPAMENTTKIAAANVINVMFFFAWMAKSPHTFLLATKSIRLCLKFGMFPGVAMPFTLYAFSRCLMGNMEEGFRYGELAMRLLERDQCRDALPMVHGFFVAGVHHRKRPLREGIEILKKGYRVGMEVGDITGAMINDSLWVAHSWYMGAKLAEVDKLIWTGLCRRKVHDHPLTRNFLRVFSQTVDRLTDKTTYTGVSDFMEAIGGSETLSRASHVESTMMLLHGAFLAYIFRDFKGAHDVLRKADRSKRKFSVAMTTGVQMEWVYCLVLMAMAREGKDRRKNMSNARVIVKLLAKRAQECPENRGHMYDLLKAEYESISDGNNTNCTVASDIRVLERYSSAMEKGSEEGFLYVAAIAAERAGDYMMRCGNVERAKDYWSRAHSQYLEWGATAKARSLETLVRKEDIN